MATYQIKLVEKSSQVTKVVELGKGKTVINTPSKHNILVLEKATGKSAQTLQMKRKGKDLLVELDHETSVEFVDYYSSEDVAFLAELDGGLSTYNLPNLHSVDELPTLTNAVSNSPSAVTVASKPVVASSGSSIGVGKVLAGVGLALGGIAGLASAGGGGKSGGSGDSTPNTNTNNTSITPPPANAQVESVSADPSVNEGQTLTATVTLDNVNGHPNLAFNLAGLEEADYNNLVFSNGVSRNNDDTLNIPKNVKTFTVSLNIIADNTTEGEQSLTFTVGDQSTIVQVADTSVTPPPPADAKVVSVTAGEKVNEGQTLTATVTLDNQNGNSKVAFNLAGLEEADYNNLVFSNGVSRNNDGTLNIPKNVKTFTVSLNIIADNTTEGEQSLTFTVGDQSTIVQVADTSVTPPPPADAKVVSVTAGEKVNEGQTLTATVTLDNQNGNSKVAFNLAGLEEADYNNLVFSNGVSRNNDGTLNIPKNVKTFTVSLNIIADNTTEGEQSLTFTVGDQSTIVQVADTSVTPPPPADAKVVSVTAGEKVNEGQTLTATVTLDNQNGNSKVAFNLAGLEEADYNNLVFSNGVSRNNDGTLNIPKNVKTFTVSLNIIADNTTEGEQSLTFTVGDQSTIVQVADTSVTPPPANAQVESVSADPSVNEGQTLTATVTLDNVNGHPNLAFNLAGLEEADYNNLVFSNGVSRNNDGTLNIPKNVKTFTVSLNIIADNTTEGVQSLNLTVGDKSAIVKVADTSVTPPPADAKVVSVTAGEKVNEGQTLTATVTLDNQNGNSKVAFNLAGLEEADYNNLVFSNGVSRNNDGTLNIPKNVKTFTVSLNIIADNTTEGEQSLTLTVGDKPAIVKVEDTSTTPVQNQAPTEITLSATSVAENDRGAVVGTLATNDPDTADSHTYTVSGDERFEIVGNQLKLKEGKFLDYEKDKTINLTITSSDGQLSKSQPFTITVTDVNDDGYIWGTDANNGYLEGTDNDDIIVGLKGNDVLLGEKGNDTYIFSKGDGQDSIKDWENPNSEFNTIKFTDVNLSDIQKTSTVANGYLGLNIHYGDGDVIKLEEQSSQHSRSKIVFADGTTMSVADLMKRVPSHIEAVPSRSRVVDTVADDIITDSSGDHLYLSDRTTSAGNDTYVFKQGGGKDIIHESDRKNKLVFTDITSDSISVSHYKDYVTIHYGNGDEVQFKANVISEIQFKDVTLSGERLTEHLNLPYWTESLLYNYALNGVYIDSNNDKTVYFAFPTVNVSEAKENWSAFTDLQKAEARKAFKNLEEFLNIKFIEKTDTVTQLENDVIYLQNSKLPLGVAGLGGPNAKGGGDVWLGSTNVTSNTLHVIAHEIGHALGLNHPRHYSGDSEPANQKRHALSETEDLGSWTIMSYDDKTRSKDYQEMDIATLQYLYGVNPNVRTGDDQYFFNSSVGQFVWDGAGSDTINASSTTENVYINLNAGTHSYVGQKSDFITAGNQLTINHGTVIEKAVGGSGNDILIGNTANNVLTGGAGNDTLTGGKGLDVFNFSPLTNDATGGHGHDTITDFYLGNIQQNTQADILNLLGLLVGHHGDKSVTGLENYLSVSQQNGNTVVSIDRDGSGTAFAQADLVTLEKVQTTLAELLANQQIII